MDWMPRTEDLPLGLSRDDDGFAQVITAGLFNPLDAALDTAPGTDPALPEEIVFPRSERDVLEIVRLARETGRRVAVRSGGHSWVASSVRGDGILIDLAALDHVRFDLADPAHPTATVGPGVRGQNLSRLLEQNGVAFPVGHCGTPAVGGFLLGGGLGVNWGHWKPACFSVLRMRVVTAAGESVTASATENPELFWLARGAGPGFPGVVTEFELALQPLPGGIRVSTWLFDLDDLPAVTEWVTEASRSLPPNVEVSLVTSGANRPDGRGASDPHPFVVGVAATAFADDVAEAERLLAPLSTAPTALEHAALLDVPFSALHEPVDDTYPVGARFLADTFWFSGDLREAMAPLQRLMRRAPSGHSYVLAGMPANGAGSRLLTPGEAAYGMHDTTCFNVYTIWHDSADDAVNRAWLDEVAATLLPMSSGHFLNEADIRRRPERVPASFRPADWERLQRLRREWDPEELFHGWPGGG
ncbi:FAD-binding oxidoreductase [Herbiconiux moechotypicola]|uniref:FAD-binding oxidoreductase n=1 Tax=Herbiconiux moechotypicola TaxID=637393 RepID=A0ABN3DMK9_9MICO|nr:FAD-binding oxidoreductase [Herbiconiux moechotypicola]MCS5730286.1 FAD-binding oxidoreductase [Herbiconiux moechotypicola]